MKKFTKHLFVWFCLFLIVASPVTVYAAPTMTTSYDAIDAWQALAVATLAVGNSEDISGSYSTILYIETAYTGAAAQAGIEVFVEISYATGDDWMQLSTFKGQAVTPGLTDLDEGGGAAAGEATITLTDATTGDFDVPGQRWFIVDTTVADSEVLRTKINATHTVTLCQDTKYAHVDTEVATDAVDQWAIAIPFGAAFVRVLINNSDADATMHWRSFCSKVTGI